MRGILIPLLVTLLCSAFLLAYVSIKVDLGYAYKIALMPIVFNLIMFAIMKIEGS